jgi:myo-inositol-1(or 4)-monophosphatase
MQMKEKDSGKNEIIASLASIDPPLAQLEAVAHSAAIKAGDLIRQNIGRIEAQDVQMKGQSDFVTRIDKECESIIIDAILSRFPDHHIMAEETPGGVLEEGFTWVIDPLDGTTNFIHGFPFVAVSIAVCLGKVAVAGVVLDPIRQELFSATRGGGATLNGRRLRVRNGVSLEQALVATGFPFRSKGVLEAYMKVFQSVFFNTSGIRRAGAAALDLAYLAAGRVDGFWEVGLKSWDVAAGSLLVEEAGGTVSDYWGTDNYIQNGHIVGGTDGVYQFLLENVRCFLAPELESK